MVIDLLFKEPSKSKNKLEKSGNKCYKKNSDLFNFEVTGYDIKMK